MARVALDGLWWQLTHTDTDGDGLMNWVESNGSGFGGQYGTNMNSSDTDGDGMGDGFEVNTTGTSPMDADTDGNGLNDLEDHLVATDPGGDYDADGLTNAEEAQLPYSVGYWGGPRTSMRQADTDGDGLNDGYEVSNYRNGENKSSSNPLLVSSDGSGVPDRQVMNYLFPSDRYGITAPGALPNATGGSSYTSPPFTVANPQGATSWAVTAGNLPATLSFNGNCLVGYAPPGSYSFTVQVTDAANRSTTADYTLVVDLAPLTITSAALVSDVLFGSPVSHSFTAAGGYGGFSWSLPYGWLPSGLYLSTDGQLSGAATYPGNYTFPVRVADMSGASAEQWVSLNVTVPALVISSQALSTGVQVGSGLSASFTAVGGTGNYSWSVPNGGLPWGMSFSSDGQLMGSPYSAGSYSFTVRVTDGIGNYAEQGACVYVSEVPPPPPPEPPQITSYQYLPSGQDGSAYSYDFSASGGSGAYTWTSWWGLPSGLSLSSSGQLAGTVSGSGSYSFTVQVTGGNGYSSSQTFYLYVASAPPPAPPQIQGPLNLSASPWTSQSWTLRASGGSGGSYAWSYWNSELPTGFSLNSDGTLTGNFEGQTGSFSFYVQVYDGSSSSYELFTVDVTDRDADGDGMLASVEHELALELGLPLNDGSRNSVQPELDDWYVYYHARLAATDGPDDDGDGLGPLLEQVLGTNPALKDTDGDFRPDWWVHYQAYGRFFDTADLDGDGLHAVLEGRMGTSDAQEDSDGDGLTDAYEWQYISYADPADDDSDNDGLNDGAELTAGTQARNADSDDDYLTDNEEVNNLYGLPLPTSPLDPDSDDDGIPDHGEVSLTDSDGGGIPDRLEEHWNMNIQDARDEADDYDGDGHSNYTAYLGGWDIHAQFVPQFDTDADGMTNLYELAKGFDPADQKDGADDPDADFLTNAEEYAAQTSPVHLLTPGYEVETVTDRDDSTGLGVFDENGAPVERAVLNDYEVASDKELFLNTTPPLTRGNSLLPTAVAEREYDDDWDQDGLSNYDELYPLYGSPTDPRVWQPPLAITTAILADGQKGAPYTAVLAHVGGQPGFTYSLASGSLPTGLGLNATAEPGVWAISGTPTAEGSHTFTLLVTDAYQRTDTQVLTLVVGPEILPPPSLEITTTSLSPGVVGVAYSTTLNASGGTGPYTFSVSGALPDGLSLSGGIISGIPTAVFDNDVTVSVTDNNLQTVSKTLRLTLTVEVGTGTGTGTGTTGGNNTGSNRSTVAPKGVATPFQVQYSGWGGVYATSWDGVEIPAYVTPAIDIPEVIVPSTTTPGATVTRRAYNGHLQERHYALANENEKPTTENGSKTTENLGREPSEEAKAAWIAANTKPSKVYLIKTVSLDTPQTENDGRMTWAKHVVTTDSDGTPSGTVENSRIEQAEYDLYQNGEKPYTTYALDADGGSSWTVPSIADDGAEYTEKLPDIVTPGYSIPGSHTPAQNHPAVPAQPASTTIDPAPGALVAKLSSQSGTPEVTETSIDVSARVGSLQDNVTYEDYNVLSSGGQIAYAESRHVQPSGAGNLETAWHNGGKAKVIFRPDWPATPEEKQQCGAKYMLVLLERKNGEDKVISVKPLNEALDEDIDIDPGAPTGDGNTSSRSLSILGVDIVPDANMAGVIGDVVESAKAGSTIKHFVTPRSDEVGPFQPGSEPHVMLKAGELTEAQFNQNYEWEGGEPVTPNNKRKVLRTSTGTGPTEVKIKAKQGGAVASQMNVWVVWAGGGRFERKPTQHSLSVTSRQNIAGYSSNAINVEPDRPWLMVFAIEPKSMFDKTAEVPDLMGTVQPSGLTGNHPILNNGQATLDGGANHHWDVSRQFKETITNNGSIAKGLFPDGAGALYANQPKANQADVAVNFPSDPITGNDDTGVIDEINDPYNPTSAGTYQTKQGEVLSHDAPKLFMTIKGLKAGEGVTDYAEFKEFVRLNVGGKWFRVSDFLDFNIKLQFTMDADLQNVTPTGTDVSPK